MKNYWLGVLILAFSSTRAQTLSELLIMAESNYPNLKAKNFETLAARSSVLSARNALLPSLDAAYQANYATSNNITGMASTQYFVPISGPPSKENSSNAVLGSAAGLLLNWDILTFGQRNARTEVASANLRVAEADTRNEIFRHKVNFIQAYLDLLFIHELLKVYEGNLERSQERSREVVTLTRVGLRPGVDTALFHAELSRAKIELLNVKKNLESQQLMLAELIGAESITYSIDSSFFNILPKSLEDAVNPNSHPLLNLTRAKYEVNKKQQKSIQRSMYPRLSLWGTTYARGSGIRYDGSINSQDGLSLSRYNYGVGVQFSLPLLRFIDAHTQLSQNSHLMNAQQERINQAELQLKTQSKVAGVTLKNSIEVAHESPAFYDAAKFSYEALLTRYNTGLANYADLVQAQYSLLKAESDLKKAYLEVWKSLLYVAAMQGDLNVFLIQAEKK
jgi:outer membrane protein